MLLHTRLLLNGSSNVVINTYNVYRAENVDQSCVAFKGEGKTYYLLGIITPQTFPQNIIS